MKTLLFFSAFFALMFFIDLVAPVLSPVLGPIAILGVVAFLVYLIIDTMKS